MAKRRKSNPSQGDLFEMLMAEMANPGLLAGGGGQTDALRRQFLAKIGVGGETPESKKTKAKRTTRGRKYRQGRSAGQAPLKPARRNKGVGKERAGKQKARPVTGSGVVTSPVRPDRQMVPSRSAAGGGTPQGPPRPPRPPRQGPPRPPAGAGGAAGGAASQPVQGPPRPSADKKGKGKGMGSKLMKGMGWMMFGMMLNDMIKQFGGQTPAARGARMSPYQMGQADQLSLGTPSDMAMNRDLSALLGANTDLTNALGPNLDRYL